MTIWFGQRGSKRSPGAGQGYGWENLNAGVRSQPHTITNGTRYCGTVATFP